MMKADEVRSQETWNLLNTGLLKKETEGLLMAPQDQALRTNSIKMKVDKQSVSPLSRLRGERDKAISHVVAQ